MTTNRQRSYTWKNLLTFLLIIAELSVTSARPWLIGGIRVGKPFTDIPCSDEDMTFYLYTKQNPDMGQQVLVNNSGSNLAHTNFVAALPTKIIVHGYQSDMNLSYLVNIRKEYLKKDRYNVIAVDWHRQASASYYTVIVHNMPHMGDCLAQLIQRLRDYGATDIHIIGFSLGAHLAACTVVPLYPYRVSRITGLDPANLLFFSSSHYKQLDRSDAEFVDVVHTDGWTQGMSTQIGHVDFYMNGGNNQPGCDSSSCDHHRAAVYFAESINSKTGFWGFPCYSTLTYSLNLCWRSYPAMLMGEDVDKNRTFDYDNDYIYVVETNERSPYAKGMFTTD